MARINQRRHRDLQLENYRLQAENKRLKQEANARMFNFKGWTIMKAECVPLGQIWMNPEEQALRRE